MKAMLYVVWGLAQLCANASFASSDSNFPQLDAILPGSVRSMVALPREKYVRPDGKLWEKEIPVFKASMNWISTVIHEDFWEEGKIRFTALVADDGVQFTQAILNSNDWIITARQSAAVMVLLVSAKSDAGFDISDSTSATNSLNLLLGTVFSDSTTEVDLGGKLQEVKGLRREIATRLFQSDPKQYAEGYASTLSNTDLADIDASLGHHVESGEKYRWFRLVNYWITNNEVGFYFLKLKGVGPRYPEFYGKPDKSWFDDVRH